MLRTDWHCHLLPGFDDGAASVDAAAAMARQLAGAGFNRICCTPHRIHGVFSSEPAAVRAAVRDLQDELNKRDIVVELLPGCEYYLDEYYLDALDSDPLLLPGKQILVEIPSRCSDGEMIVSLLSHTKRRGYVPLIAHPERSSLLLPPGRPAESFSCRLASLFGRKEAKNEPPDLLRQIVGLGCAFQGNLGSFAGWYGSQVRTQAQRLHAGGCYSAYGSDAHSPESLAAYLDDGLATLQKGSA